MEKTFLKLLIWMLILSLGTAILAISLGYGTVAGFVAGFNIASLFACVLRLNKKI